MTLLLNSCCFFFSLKTGTVLIFLIWIFQHGAVVIELTNKKTAYGGLLKFNTNDKKNPFYNEKTLAYVVVILYFIASCVGLYGICKGRRDRDLLKPALVFALIGTILGFAMVFLPTFRTQKHWATAVIWASFYTMFPLYFIAVIYSFAERRSLLSGIFLN